ncbi:MAG TPA: hypothetical protein VID95_06260 [Candidatus Limnocylindrales bacterium]
MDTVLERIAAWQAAGLIDEATADRLRAAEPPDTQEPAAPPRHSSVAAAAGSFFGPTPTIVEMFGYLGALFLIAAWSAFMVRIAGSSESTGSNATVLAAGAAVAAAVLLGIGVALRNGEARRRRAGGAAILFATFAAIGAGGFLGQGLGLSPATSAIVAAATGFVVATLGRIVLPSVTTQAAFLLALTSLGYAVLVWLQPQSREADFGLGGTEPAGDVVTMVIVPAIGWLLLAVGLGALGLAEAGAPGAPAQRRAGLTRLWAGLVAVAGVATSVFTTGSLGNGDYGRLLEPWIGELAVLVVSLVLVERAFRRESSAFILAAAIGLITALTDFNFTYLTSSTDVGLLVEGLILIGAGVAADRLRRRIDRSREAPPDDATPLDGAPAEAPAPSA